jgi:HlyD family secretion protein
MKLHNLITLIASSIRRLILQAWDLNYLKMERYLKQNESFKMLEQSPGIKKTIAKMDVAIQFMTKQNYISSNPIITMVRTPLVIGLWTILIITIITLIWGTIVPIESAAVAKGTVVLQSNKKSIQHLEGGIIQEILIHEGETVKAGQELIRLNDTAAIANRDVLQGRLYTNRANEARLLALLDKQTSITFGDDMIKNSQTNDTLAKSMSIQIQLFYSAQDTQKTKLSILAERISQSEKEIEGLKSQIKGTSSQIALDNEEAESSQILIKKGYDTKTRLFKIKRHQDELQGNLGQHIAEVAKVQQAIAELQMQIINQQNDFETKNSQELRDVQAQISDLIDSLNQANDIVNRTVITAPVGGVITALKYHTIGGVIPPGAQIMDIIPQDDLLIIEAHLKPNDISEVHSGLEAKVIFTAYKMRATPKVPGKVTQVSADIFNDEHISQAAPYYTARIEVDKSFIANMAKPVELYPGMPAEVLIRTGSRSFFGYLFKPITDSMHSAFREK